MKSIETYLIDKETHFKVEKISLKYDIQNSKVSLSLRLIGKISFLEIDLLEGYWRIQDFLENKGYLLCLNDSRFDVQSSGFLRGSTNGISTYLFTDEFDKEKEILNIYDIIIGSKKEQKKYYKEWKMKYKKYVDSLNYPYYCLRLDLSKKAESKSFGRQKVLVFY